MAAAASQWSEMLNLPEVTVCAASSVALPQTLAALRSSMKHIRFGAAKLFTDDVKGEVDDIEIIKIAPIRSRNGYSRFVLKELVDHISTDFVLIVQWDGYVIRPLAWRRTFMDYDYIGAVWPQFYDGLNVGNGGFSLRSRKLLEVCAKSCTFSDEAEDVFICRTNRKLLEHEYGIRFANSEIASHFSYERTAPQGTEFGFHGVFNMPAILGGSAFTELYRNLPKAVIGRKEHRDLFSLALVHGHDDLSREIIRYHLSGVSLIGRGVHFAMRKAIHNRRNYGS